jgi:GTP-binding protein EngB required for normal cell division
MSQIVADFISATSQANARIRAFEGRLEERHQTVQRIIADLGATIHAPLTSEARSSPILEEILQKLSDSMAVWKASLEREVDGQEFSQIFDKSLIVMVYGKVNSGKSSLGNFLAGQVFEELALPFYEGLKPRFRVHASTSTADEVESKEVESFFAVDARECTREIQEFTLGGLSWVDTPGIHSLRDDNQALARRYVESAELVIYLTDSSSPARESDMREMSSLLDQGKRAIIVVSKFDEIIDEDFDDEGNLVSIMGMKSERSHEEQRGWIEEQIQTHGLDPLLHDRQYCFISTRFARGALVRGEDADGVLKESGLAKLYTMLGAILTDDAIDLKERAPRRRFNQLLDDIAGTKERTDNDASLTNRRASLKRFAGEIEKRRAHLATLETDVTSRAIHTARPQIEARLYASHDKVNGGMTDPGLTSDITMIIGDALSAALKQTLAKSFHEILSSLADLKLQTGDWEVPSIDVVFDDIEISTSERNSKVGAALGGLPGSAIGGALGGTFGPLGIAIGSVLGGLVAGALGGALGKAVSGTTKEQIKMGTNLDEVASRLLKQVNSKLGGVVKTNLEALAVSYFDPLIDAIERIDGSLKQAQTELDGLR